MFKSKNEEERNQEIRDQFAELWKHSSQHEHNEEFYLVTHQQVKFKIWLEEDPFRLYMEIHVGGWMFEKDEVDKEAIMSFLSDLVCE